MEDNNVDGKQNGQNGSVPGSRKQSTTDQPFEDQIDRKKDPYGDLLKKVVQVKDGSPDTNGDRSSPETTESTPRSERKVRGNAPATPRDRPRGPSLRTRQVTLMLFIITVVFVLSFIPHLGLMVTISFKPDFLSNMSPAGVAIYNLFLRTFVINNMANPIIYGFCDKKFRSECASVLRLRSFCACCRR